MTGSMALNKVCTKCGVEKPALAFYAKGSRRDSECKTCRNKKIAAWKANNQEKILEYQKGRTGAGKLAAAAKAWRLAHPEKVKNREKGITENLIDAYVIKCLRLPREYCTPELIAVKRAQIELIRLKNQLTKELNRAIKNQSHGVTQ